MRDMLPYAQAKLVDGHVLEWQLKMVLVVSKM